MIKKLIQFIISRFKYANKVDLVKCLLNGIDDEDIKKLCAVVDGRINPILISDKSGYDTISIDDIMKGIPIVIQDNKLIGYSKFEMIYDKTWKIKLVTNGEEILLEQDDHTKVYLLI